ncbi:MAG: sulfite exporter TauE/SafE family protein [Patescibacteria group bacterium]|nr:sulfite exporter TauE/SafE family protein [Patescibacteria group bacterium]MDD4303912.1 sulfite exporter TauE/SafE family protein [Patescibacteria group bacterium]MDD4695101.1 sulfite exporter TauE/SafE family protein [Patescibacteria group bacterium]
MELIIIFIVTFITQMLGVMVGGNRNVLLPLLMFMGLPSNEALATFKTGGLGSFASLIKFHKHHYIKWKMAIYLIPFITIGSSIGSIIVINMNPELFKKIISISVLISLLMFSFRKKNKIREIKIKNNFWIYIMSLFTGLVSGCIGFMGIFLQYLYMGSGMTFIEATATKKITNFVSNIVSFIIFVLAGIINWRIAGIMFVASFFGSWIGTSLGIKVGNVWLEKIFVIVTFVGVIKILFY